uniref:Uncharacterized protein n=1 Tax=Arundo donax TaxID=35708 RepID=A0A0A9B9X8_ARUDO
MPKTGMCCFSSIAQAAKSY